VWARCDREILHGYIYRSPRASHRRPRTSAGRELAADEVARSSRERASQPRSEAVMELCGSATFAHACLVVSVPVTIGGRQSGERQWRYGTCSSLVIHRQVLPDGKWTPPAGHLHSSSSA